MKLIIYISVLLWLSFGCAQFNLKSLNQAQVKRLLSTPAFESVGIGLGLIDNKTRFFMRNDNYYFEVLDSLGINKDKDSLYFYQYLSKFFEHINVQISNIVITLKANDKELIALAEYSKRNIISVKDFTGDDELFNENISEFTIEVNYTILIEGSLRNQNDNKPIMKENQSYFIHKKDGKTVSAYYYYN